MRFYHVLLIAITIIIAGCESRTGQIHTAVGENDIKKVKKLLDKKLSPDSLNEYGATPLCYAAYEGHAEAANILVQYGADVGKECHIVDGDIKDTWWPLQMAVERGNYGNPEGHEAVAIMLIEKGADVNLSDHNGYTLVHHAIFSEPLTRLLIEKGADINARSKSGATPLIFATINGDEDAVRFLLELGADVNVKNNKGETVRDHALQKKDHPLQKNSVEWERILEIIDSLQNMKKD